MHRARQGRQILRHAESAGPLREPQPRRIPFRREVLSRRVHVDCVLQAQVRRRYQRLFQNGRCVSLNLLYRMLILKVRSRRHILPRARKLSFCSVLVLNIRIFPSKRNHLPRLSKRPWQIVKVTGVLFHFLLLP